MWALSSGHPYMMTSCKDLSVVSLLVSFRILCSVFSVSLEFLSFAADTISMWNTSNPVTFTGLGCGRAARESVTAR